MSKFNLVKKSNLHRFKSLKIIQNSSNEKIVLESIDFLGRKIEIKTKHVIIPPNLHEVFILNGPAKGTSFIEKYESNPTGTDISISVDLKLNGFLKLIPFLKLLLFKKMNSVMSEFIVCAESYSKSVSK